MSAAKSNTLRRLVRLGRGKCTGCDRIRVLYDWQEWAGSPGFAHTPYRRERYCMECHPETSKPNAEALPRREAT